MYSVDHSDIFDHMYIALHWACQYARIHVFTFSKQSFDESLDFLQPFIASWTFQKIEHIAYIYILL